MNKIRMTARKNSWCACGARIRPGTEMLWDAEHKKSAGCPACNFTGVRTIEDDHLRNYDDNPFMEEPWELFHDEF